MTAIRDIAAERKRQREGEGFTDERDDAYETCELSVAAGCYAFAAAEPFKNVNNPVPVEDWPWSNSWWKPTTRRRNLVKAGALIVAEIERLDRISASCEHPVHSNPGMVAPCPVCHYDPFEYQDITGAMKADDPFKTLTDMYHLLIECRDALPAISQASQRLHSVSPTLDVRIEAVLKPWVADPDDPDAI